MMRWYGERKGKGTEGRTFDFSSAVAANTLVVELFDFLFLGCGKREGVAEVVFFGLVVCWRS